MHGRGRVLARMTLLNQHAKRMRRIVYSLSGTTIFFDIISKRQDFRERT
jgi:hypothetical protein